MRWSDEIRKVAGVNWMTKALYREKQCKNLEVIYNLQWFENGCWWYIYIYYFDRNMTPFLLLHFFIHISSKFIYKNIFYSLCTQKLRKRNALKKKTLSFSFFFSYIDIFLDYFKRINISLSCEKFRNYAVFI